MKTKITVILLLSIFALLGLTSMLRKSATCDEVAHHIPSGYVFLKEHDLRFDTCAPPLARYIVAFPLLFMNLDMPDNKDFWRREDRAQFGRDFFKLNMGKYKEILLSSRVMVLIVSIVGGLVLYLWTKNLYSKRVGILALFLYALSPNMLAHARLATTDAVTTVFILLFAFMFWRFLQSPGYSKAVISGISFGLALLSKYSALLILPIILVFFIPIIKKGAVKKGLMLFLLFNLSAFLTIWAGYGFEITPLLAGTLRAQEKFLIISKFCSSICPFFSETLLHNMLYNLPMPLSSYILGILGVIRHGADGHSFFFLGNWYSHGLPYYYVVAFFIKTPLPMLIAFLWGILLLIKERPAKREYYLLSFISVFLLAASFSKLQLGLRYILPVYPFCFMIAGRLFVSIFNKRLIYKLFAILLLIWYSMSSIYIWPDYLSYFNEIIGGPSHGWKYLRDSDLDWGQDLPALKSYMKKNNMEEIELLYYGEGLPSAYNIIHKDITAENKVMPKKNVYAVSVTSLESVQWAVQYKPTVKLGYSIFIYDLR